MTVLSNYEKAGRVVNDGRFLNRLKASIVAQAIEKDQSVMSRQDLVPALAWAVAVNLIDSYANSIVDGTDEEISASVEAAISAVTDAEIDASVDAVWDVALGVPAVEVLSGQEKLARLSNDLQFQSRVYQIIAAKANGVLAQPAVPGNEANMIMRGFAMRLQAGLYLTPQFKQNFAFNVLGAIGNVDSVTDQSLSTAIDQLLGLFIASRLELIAAGKTLETVIS